VESKPVPLKKVFLAFLILCLASLACLGPSLATPGDYMEDFGGNMTVYTRILYMTDCTELQRELERAEENAKLQEPGTQEYKAAMGYQTAADNHLKDVGCTGGL
jgi:hypothetical protein